MHREPTCAPTLFFSFSLLLDVLECTLLLVEPLLGMAAPVQLFPVDVRRPVGFESMNLKVNLQVAAPVA